jgi:phytoene desaturase
MAKPDRFRGPIDRSYDVVVVGAGPGGLVTSALLSRAGKRVLLLDGHYVAGGNATLFRRKDYEFDIGIHYLGDCGPGGLIPTILHACGVDGIRFRPMDPDFEQVTFPDLEFSIPRDKAEFEKRLVALFPEERRGIRRYIKLLDQTDLVQRAGLSGSKFKALAALLRCPLVLRYANKTFGEFLDSCIDNVKLKAVLSSQHGTYTVAPGRVSAMLHAGVQNHYFVNGGWFPEGGGQRISDCLAESIETNGGRILLTSRVGRIRVVDGRVEGVTFDNKHLGTVDVNAPVVVSNADLKRTVRDLVGTEHFPEGYAGRVERFEMALPLFVVYLGLDIPASELPYGNVNRWVYDGYDFDADYEMMRNSRMPDKPFVYIATTSKKDPNNDSLAPPNHTNLQVMSACPSTAEFWGITDESQIFDGSYEASEQYGYMKEKIAARMLEQAEKAIPGLSEHIVFKEAATPLTHTRYTRSSEGTSYGIAATPGQFLNNRPSSSTPIEGLFLAGASMRNGHGIAGSMLSGVFAADAVLRDGTAKRLLTSWGSDRV